ncbi:MAG: hypothetical protein D6726_05535 [Nitrospirae bacterium]|nr:MAG: hypothetical protein D6726_05535 [Nitrospirota bacterium]
MLKKWEKVTMPSIFYVLILLFLLIPSPSIASGPKRYNVPVGDSPTLGPQDAPVTIIEFLDYQ